jgi:hypothetical protein
MTITMTMVVTARENNDNNNNNDNEVYMSLLMSKIDTIVRMRWYYLDYSTTGMNAKQWWYNFSFMPSITTIFFSSWQFRSSTEGTS